jgi:N-acetylglucosaminyldiphosphoundecaprenol N-acetyl-beta-D-mannosaminyltransferase
MSRLVTAPVLGVDCFAGDLESAATAVAGRVESQAGGYACLSNVHTLVSAVHDPALRRVLSDAWVVFPDGSPVAWLQRRQGRRDAARIAGPDLMTRMLSAGGRSEFRHYLYGATSPVLDRLTHRFTNAVICGTYAPPYTTFDAPEHDRAVEIVQSTQPDIVWCGLGMPKQELWMERYAPTLAPALVLGVGAAFDFLSGNKPRAPRAVQRVGLEWAHRLAAEPRRLSGRYFSTNTEFLLLLIGEMLRNRRRG